MSDDSRSLDEAVGLEIITIAVDMSHGTISVDLGTVTPSSASSIMRNLVKWLDKFQPPPQISYDGMIVMDTFDHRFMDDEDEDEDEDDEFEEEDLEGP